MSSSFVTFDFGHDDVNLFVSLPETRPTDSTISSIPWIGTDRVKNVPTFIDAGEWCCPTSALGYSSTLGTFNSNDAV